ncbi:MAG: hypothetical protein JO222_01480 [Frankiales bacterium]|nr:hypothetical protein [Frankiales bacterium]
MIVRILGEGQLDVPDSELDALNELDDKVQAAVDSGDDDGFSAALVALLERVRSSGRALTDDDIVPSDLVLPSPDASLAEVRELLGDEGLIPG